MHTLATLSPDKVVALCTCWLPSTVYAHTRTHLVSVPHLYQLVFVLTITFNNGIYTIPIWIWIWNSNRGKEIKKEMEIVDFL